MGAFRHRTANNRRRRRREYVLKEEARIVGRAAEEKLGIAEK